ncbi:uncharacterized protein LOC142356131 isoform X2 [Convolutriloba macropyga]|uniref:uncharacterized protein LOC142356131 isoform X2 n=1 Tax=Convolutriloba macropyga TaxID=536237 RepID=UPI003F51D1E6
MGYFSVISGLICLLSIMRTGETSKMYNIHEVITMASFDKPTVRKDEAARFVCQYGAMMEFGEERFHAIILFPNGKRFISDMLQYKPEGIEVDYNEVENSFEMKIAHVKMSHAGEYGCTYMVGSNANHDVKIVGESPTRRDSLRVIVGTSPPTIEEFSNNENKVNKNNNTGSKVREVRVGQLRNLTCVVRQSYPQADIEWTDERGNSLHEIPTIYFHTQTLNSFASNIVTVYEKNDGLLLTKSTMSFTPSRDQDKQKVVCRAKNEADLGFKNDTIILSVLYAPIAEVSISPKLIDEDTPKVTALCKTSSNPPIDQFKWYIGSRLIEKETSNTLVLQGINQDSYKDTVIKCEAINALGSSKKASGELNFIRKPEFTKIPNVEYKVILGDEVRMECAAEGHPSPRIEWLREGYDRVLSYEETLVVNSADFSSAGVYICRAVVNNMYLAESRARVTVFGPPSLLATRRKYSKIGSMATLECSVSTRVTKPTNMYWRHNELKFEEGQFVNKYIVEKKEMNDSWTLLLTILDLKEENFGDYNCTVFNHAGNDTVTVSLLQPPPVAIIPSRPSSVVPQDEMSIIIMGSCVAGALIILLFAIVIALICYCQQGPKGGKHHPVDQKPPPDLPPSYRRDISSPTHHIGMPPPQMPPPAIPTHQMQQDYVDMDGVLMGGAGLGALGGTPPPPPPQLYPTMMSQRGGNQTFYGSRADDINSIEDGCKNSFSIIADETIAGPFGHHRRAGLWNAPSSSLLADALTQNPAFNVNLSTHNLSPGFDSLNPENVHYPNSSNRSIKQNSSEHDSSENGDFPINNVLHSPSGNQSLTDGHDLRIVSENEQMEDFQSASENPQIILNSDPSDSDHYVVSGDNIYNVPSQINIPATSGRKNSFGTNFPKLKTPVLQSTLSLDTSNLSNQHPFTYQRYGHAGSVELSTFKPGTPESHSQIFQPKSGTLRGPVSPLWNTASDILPYTPTPTNQKRPFYNTSTIHPAYNSLNSSNQSFTLGRDVNTFGYPARAELSPRQQFATSPTESFGSSTGTLTRGAPGTPRLNVVRRIPVLPNNMGDLPASNFQSMNRSPLGRVRYTPRNVRFIELPKFDPSLTCESDNGTLTRKSVSPKII